MSCKTYIPVCVDEDIVISGMSGRFPESDSIDEFATNLYNKTDMITLDNRRWRPDLYGMCGRMGKLKDIEKFDGLFFGVMSTMGDSIDPQSRILLETAYECIIDAGINPQSLRGSDTGVYIGYSSFGMPDGIPEEVQPDSQSNMTDTLLWIQGSNKCLYANRVSFVFDFKGPSIFIDTACSSSLVAFNIALNDLRLGKCKQAIVGGTSINLQPFTNHVFQSTHLNSRDGIPKVWDDKADGFVRGETIACLLLQRKSDSKRIYATVLNSGVNIDGNKRMGMFFPSAETQEELMVRVYEEANIDPLKVNYFEAHATGTKVGDPQEAKAIFNAYCSKPKREGILPVGLLKSNIGHAEGASGVSSVAKVLISFENECIPSSLHLNKLKGNIKAYCPPIHPIDDHYPYTPGIAGVNNFGVGGVNAHVLLETNYKTKSETNERIAETIPRLVNICSRTEDGFNKLIKFFEEKPEKITPDFLALIADTMKNKPHLNSTGMPFRGHLLIKESVAENGDIQRDIKSHFSSFTAKTNRPVWFLFPGLGGQWTGMAKALMPIKIFGDRIEECHQILKPFNIDLKHLLLSDDPNSMSSMTNKFCATTAIEIALFDVISALNIIPDGIIGHSFGEIAAAYADGCLTAKEALLVTYWRGVVTESDKKIPKGLMAVAGLNWNEAKKMCPKGTSVVCNNGKDTVVISGLYNETKAMVEDLSKKGVFVRELQSHDIPYHSEYLMTSAKKLTEVLKKCVPNPKPRSKKWVSTAVIESDPEDALKLASAEYFVHNLISPVFFYNKMKYLPMDAIVVEIGPHGLFSKLISQTLDSSTYMSLIKKDSNDTNLDMLLGSIARLYELGLNPDIENLYPKVQWPVVRGTQSISSLMNWDHSESYFVRKWPDYHFKSTASELTENINLKREIKSFLPDHCIDGNVLFPATGYLMSAWRQLASHKGKLWNQLPIIFEDVQFRRPIFLTENDSTKLKVRYLEQTGDFVILENGNICCQGRMRSPDEYTLAVQSLVMEQPKDEGFEVEIERSDIYKDLRVVGYDYGTKFRGLSKLGTNDFEIMRGEVEWDGNWVPFMDSLLQTMAASMPFRKMMVPVMIKQLRCDPKVLYEAVAANKVDDKPQGSFDDEKTFDDIMKEDLDKKCDKDFSTILDTNNVDTVEELIGENFHIYKSMIPFYVDMNARMIVAPGIEVEDLMALPIPRKVNVQDLKLESYEFIANEDYNAIEEYDKKQILEYVKVCSTVVNKIKQSLDNDSNDQKKFELNDDLVQEYVKDIKDNQILLKVLNEIQKQTNDANNNIKDGKINEFVTDLLKNPEMDMSSDVINQVSKNERLIRSLLDIVSENNIPKKDIKVLEINLSNGLMADEVDNHLASSHIYPIEVDYNIAVKSTDNVDEDLKKKSFKITEWDSTKSDFPSDITLANLVLVKDSEDLWNLKLESFVQELYDCISSKGFLISVFRYRLTEPELKLNAMNGRKNMNDSDLLKRINDFVKEAEKVGFNVVCSKSDSIGSMALLFRKIISRKPEIPHKNNVIEINSKSEQWFEAVKQKLLLKKESETSDETVWLIANDSSKNGILGLINCLRLEPGGEALRCLFDYDNLIKLPINFREKPFSDVLANDLAINVLKNGKLGSYRHLTLPKDYDKTQSNEYFLNNGMNKDLSSLQWWDMKNLNRKTEAYDLQNRLTKCIKTNIYSSGLNFKDVMFATGRIASGPMSLFTDCLIGLEFAGRRTDTGVRVMGFDMSRCFATSIDAMEELITPIPDNWSMDDAVTILCTYSTLWYGLIKRAHIKKGESILIHSGCGGVGQAAITICQNYDMDIFVTVGTDDKKKFLMTEYNIPENRIFSSRDIQFKFKIKALTKGKGVNVVLNSLTGDKLEASYECVADCGRFVEIGKYDLQMNKQLGMFSFLRDISFIGVSADRAMFLSRDFMSGFFEWMHNNCNNGMIKPINRTIFKAEEAEKAFRYMTTGKHIGKIVLKMREEENMKIVIKGYTPAPVLRTTAKTYFNANKVYIITGGLGGFGIELLHWMLHLGARKFILTSRKGVSTQYQKYILSRLKSFGNTLEMFKSEIVVSTHNTNTIEGTKSLIEEANKVGPIGGVFHLALVLNDCLLENHTIEKFNETIDSKTKTFDNFDKISRELSIDLDYFVVFSSVACGKGNAGQSNYGYANSVCERICELRRKDGLSGQAIQWGPIGDVGVIADTEMSSLSGILKQRINSCLDTLDKLLQTPKPVVSCVVRAKRMTQNGTKESRIVGQIWNALGIDPKSTPDMLTLGEIGMESMFAVELQQGLERDYDIKISLNDVKNVTIKMMKDFESGKIEKLRDFVNELNDCRSKLSKIKFLIPTEAYTRLNNVKTGKPVYFLPPLEGIFASLEALAEKIDRPVIGLNWLKNMEDMGSLKDITKYYTNLLRELHPKGDYDVVGHFYGALIAMQMLKKKAPMGKTVIIDMLSDIKIDEDMISDEYVLELVITFIGKDLPQVVKDKIRRDTALKPDVISKLVKISDELKDFVGKSLVSRDLEDILINSFKRAKLFTGYRFNMKNKFKKRILDIGRKYLEMSGKLLIIKLMDFGGSTTIDANDMSDRIKNAYFLPEKGLEGKLNFETIDANPEAISMNAFDRIANYINDYLVKK